ncbi:MAG TPA: hypothetical protein VFB92_05300 [Vicinamibacterales bacterium]|jgi:hypothetical protein|nr:hypothetical protein [Vicinamibacterales bacterium]
MVLEGNVVRKRINIGSKSEHNAAMLVTSDGEFKLRVQGGHPFADPEVDTLVGKRIRGEGFTSAGQFIMERYEVLRG